MPPRLEDRVDGIVYRIERTKWVNRVFDREGTKFKISLAMPDEANDMIAVVNLRREESYLDVPTTPEVTPPAYLKINDILRSYGIQPIYGHKAR